MDNPMALFALAIYIFLIVIVIKLLFVFLCDFPKFMKDLPDRIAEKMIEKLREEEKRKQTEQNQSKS